MGANGSRRSLQQREEQTELLMQQNTEIAKQLAQQLAAHRKKPGSIVHQIGKNIFEHLKPNNHGLADRNKKKLIEVEGVTYEIIDFISQGGFGEVYTAQNCSNKRMVAIKIMKNLPDIREEIQNEIGFLRLIKSVPIENHPIINYYGSQFTKDNIHIAMELASCDLVAFWLTHMTSIEPENKFLLGITIIIYVLRALTFLEKLNIIHGDIKPQNLVIVPGNDNFYIKLIDFGTVEKMDTCRAQITVDATKAHTIFFASPEFLRRDSNHVMARHLHKKSDAWAAGVMFYFLFFERLPWTDQFDYENFCNDPNAKDIVVPRKGGYKLIIELLLKKNPEERSSAKATLQQMIGHTELQDIIESLDANFCSINDVCRMRVPEDVQKQLAKLARPGHFAGGSKPSLIRTPSGSRRQCRYQHNCYNQNSDHREEFSHPGDSDYRTSRCASNNQFDKPKCRYGSSCYRKDTEHLSRYAHPIDRKHFSNSDDDPQHSAKPKCRYGAECYNKDPDHRALFAHPHKSTGARWSKTKCLYGDRCNKKDDRDHMAKFEH